MNVTVVLSGGVGARFGNELPKQYQSLLDKEVIEYVINAVTAASSNDKSLIVAAKSDMPRLVNTYKIDCVYAGSTHNASVKNGIDYIKSHMPECKNVMFVDAARPFIEASIIDSYFRDLEEYDAVITTKRITDSLGYKNELYIDRTDYYLIQKPEAFRFEMLYEIFTCDSTVTAIVQQLPNYTKVHKRFITSHNLKITYPDDLLLAEFLMKQQTYTSE